MSICQNCLQPPPKKNIYIYIEKTEFGFPFDFSSNQPERGCFLLGLPKRNNGLACLEVPLTLSTPGSKLSWQPLASACWLGCSVSPRKGETMSGERSRFGELFEPEADPTWKPVGCFSWVWGHLIPHWNRKPCPQTETRNLLEQKKRSARGQWRKGTNMKPTSLANSNSFDASFGN